MQNIPLGTYKNAQDVLGTCLVLSLTVYIFWHEVKLMMFADWLKRICS
jgi:hypothetical protein